MKTMGCIRMRGLAGCLLVFLAAFALVSCGDDNPASPDPTPTDEKGEVSFEISTEGGTGGLIKLWAGKNVSWFMEIMM